MNNFMPKERIVNMYSNSLKRSYIIYYYETEFSCIFSCMVYSIEEAREKKDKYLRSIA